MLIIIVSGNAVAASTYYLCNRNHSHDDICLFHFKLESAQLNKVTSMYKIKPGFGRGTVIDLKQSKYEI